jgi:hypothetical protein
MRAKATGAKDPLADGELGDRRADCGDLTGQLTAENGALGATQAEEGAHEDGMSPQPPTIAAVDSRRVDLDQELVVPGDRLLDLCELLHLGRSIPVVDHCSHERTSFLWLAAHEIDHWRDHRSSHDASVASPPLSVQRSVGWPSSTKRASP